MRRHLLGRAALLAAVAAFVLVFSGGIHAGSTPERLTDAEFWKLSQDLSEPNGSFRSENMLSNEMVLRGLLPEVVSRVKPGGVYLGVGPEQNFTYIAAVRPKLAFIIDIRRRNMLAAGHQWPGIVAKDRFSSQ